MIIWSYIWFYIVVLMCLCKWVVLNMSPKTVLWFVTWCDCDKRQSIQRVEQITDIGQHSVPGSDLQRANHLPKLPLCRCGYYTTIFICNIWLHNVFGLCFIFHNKCKNSMINAFLNVFIVWTLISRQCAVSRFSPLNLLCCSKHCFFSLNTNSNEKATN